nr:PREDICTED: uncharacterized protein LOC109631493 isoform X3 [Paralichthys olivaceus]
MQPGLSSKSELFDSLKVYLNNKKRLQPIIGLGSIIEYVKAGAQRREASYLCEVCVCRLNKADMRNHIMGSLHRYNYIKAWHPQLVCEWKENSDLSRLAWPLMEIAKKIEGKEGSGDVQLIEVEDVLYQKMATLSENDAVTLIQTVRDWQGEPESHSQTTSVQLEQHSLQSQRIVLLGRNQLLRSERSLDADVISRKTSTQTNNPHLTHSSAAPTIKSEGWLTNTSTPQSNNIEATVFSENSSSFLDGYTGTKPLIGLCRVVECRSDTGCTYVFLCHCCRVRSNKRDIIDHLTGSSHLINYLMETHPEQVEASTADNNDSFLQSLAEKVEREEGRGDLKFLNILCSQVINAPESLCIPLTGKSYHWCMRMLCNGWKTSTQKNKLTVRGHRVNKTLVEGVTEKHAAPLSKWVKSKTARRKKGKVADTLFTSPTLATACRSAMLDRLPLTILNMTSTVEMQRTVNTWLIVIPVIMNNSAIPKTQLRENTTRVMWKGIITDTTVLKRDQEGTLMKGWQQKSDTNTRRSCQLPSPKVTFSAHLRWVMLKSGITNNCSKIITWHQII